MSRWDFWTEGADGEEYCESVHQLAQRLQPKMGLEIGVRFGKSALAAMLGSPEMKLIGIDPNPEFPVEEFMREHVGDRFEFINEASPDALKRFKPQTFDWIYVDGRHDYDGVMADFWAAWPLLKYGGAMVFDDYDDSLGYGTDVKQVLEDHTKAITGRTFEYKTMTDFDCMPNPHGAAVLVKRLTMKDTPWAVDILREGAGLLDKLGVKWWLECGALLGIHREGKLLDHDDPDLDITIPEPVDHDAIREVFLESGFEVFAEGNHQLVLKKRDVLFDISYYRIEGDQLVMEIFGAGKAVQPLSLFEPLGEIPFAGRLYPTTNNVEAYLVQRYGEDWRVPKDEKRPWTEPGETLVWQNG